MENLKNGEERPKSIDEPVFILFCDSSDKVEIVEACGN